MNLLVYFQPTKANMFTITLVRLVKANFCPAMAKN
jgi:hypothetical protein